MSFLVMHKTVDINFGRVSFSVYSDGSLRVRLVSTDAWELVRPSTVGDERWRRDTWSGGECVTGWCTTNDLPAVLSSICLRFGVT